jgi:putative DNA primase/helicase
VALAPFPEALRALLEEKHRQRYEAAAGEAIPEGKRHTTLVSLAGSMRRCGMTEAEILAALRVVSEQRCMPPLPLAEVRGIAHSVARYSPTPGQVRDDTFDEAVWAALRRRA